MRLYETLKAAKIGAASDVFTTLRAQQAPFAKGGYTPTEKELEGIPPLSFSANGENLIAYGIDGNMSQSGTPTSASPVYPSECGELVESGAHSGEYAIPVQCGGSTSNIYLSEPIRKLGTYKDIVNSIGTVTRQIKKLVLTGEESGWFLSGTNSYGIANFGLPNALDSFVANNPVCTHFVYQTTLQSNTETEGIITNQQLSLYVRVTAANLPNKTAFTDWLKAQYSNGTPVCVWYVLSTPTTESFTAPTIPTSNGSNTLNVNTTLAPSNVYIKYKG